MPTLQIRSLDEDIYRALQRAARREHRSLVQQAVATLEAAVRAVPDGRARRVALLAEIAGADQEEWPADLPAPADVVQEDRER